MAPPPPHALLVRASLQSNGHLTLKWGQQAQAGRLVWAVPCSARQCLAGLASTACQQEMQELLRLMGLLRPMQCSSMSPCTLPPLIKDQIFRPGAAVFSMDRCAPALHKQHAQHLSSWLVTDCAQHAQHIREGTEGVRGRCGWQQALLASLPLHGGAMHPSGRSSWSQAVAGWGQAALLNRQEEPSLALHAQGVHVALLSTA